MRTKEFSWTKFSWTFVGKVLGVNAPKDRIHYITCYLLDAFIQSDLHTQYCGQSPQEQFGVKCLRNTTTCWLQWGLNLWPPDPNTCAQSTAPHAALYLLSLLNIQLWWPITLWKKGVCMRSHYNVTGVVHWRRETDTRVSISSYWSIPTPTLVWIHQHFRSIRPPLASFIQIHIHMLY